VRRASFARQVSSPGSGDWGDCGHRFEKASDHLSVVRLSGEGIESEELDISKKRYLALYHSASWCPPCQAFSPHLSEFYHASNKKNFELVMVGHDRSKEEMIRYMKQHGMEFPAVLWPEAGDWGATPSGSGIPNLVIVDMQTRHVVEESYKGGHYQGPDVPLEALRQCLRSSSR